MSAAVPEAVVIGASAGALEALSAILPALPADFPLPVLVVVHIPPDRRSALPQIFQAKCKVTVKEADDKEPIVGGTVYFAPPDYHLLVEADRHVALSRDAAVLFSRPSIDVLFESAADAFADALLAIVLTGANQDGSKGLQAVVSSGGRAIVQNPQGAFAAAMPEAAIKAVPGTSVMSLEQIAGYLQDMGVGP